MVLLPSSLGTVVIERQIFFGNQLGLELFNFRFGWRRLNNQYFTLVGINDCICYIKYFVLLFFKSNDCHNTCFLCNRAIITVDATHLCRNELFVLRAQQHKSWLWLPIKRSRFPGRVKKFYKIIEMVIIARSLEVGILAPLPQRARNATDSAPNLSPVLSYYEDPIHTRAL